MMMDQPASPAAGRQSFFAQLPAQPDKARLLRHAFASYIAESDWSSDQAETVTLAVGEAINNAVSYGREQPDAQISICCGLSSAGSLCIDIRNAGGDFRPDLSTLRALPEDLAVHGRGFALMFMLMDEVHVFSEDQETVVRLIKHRPA
jgi:anti-sigma regulatory factor (Ser/Thr protein kinase)